MIAIERNGDGKGGSTVLAHNLGMWCNNAATMFVSQQETKLLVGPGNPDVEIITSTSEVTSP